MQGIANELMRTEEKEFIPGFKKVERWKLKKLVADINLIVEDIQTNNISETNKLFNALSMYCV